MDYLAHALWTRAVYHKTPHPWYGAFWGVFPDTIAWVPFLFYRIFTHGLSSGRPDLALPAWMDFMYGFSHSLIIFGVTCLLVYLLTRRIPIYLWGWLIHIAIDIPTHAAEMWPTPFLWPLGDIKFPGVSWGTSWFMIANYTLLAGVYLYLYFSARRKS